MLRDHKRSHKCAISIPHPLCLCLFALCIYVHTYSTVATNRRQRRKGMAAIAHSMQMRQAEAKPCIMQMTRPARNARANCMSRPRPASSIPAVGQATLHCCCSRCGWVRSTLPPPTALYAPQVGLTEGRQQGSFSCVSINAI